MTAEHAIELTDAEQLVIAQALAYRATFDPDADTHTLTELADRITAAERIYLTTWHRAE